MPPAKIDLRKLTESPLIRSITTPLGFYVLTLLIVESTMAIVLSYSKLSEEHVWDGFLCMLAIFAVVVIFVTILVFWLPRNLLYGKEEHVNQALETSALKDQIDDLIEKRVKSDCLKIPEN